MTLGSDSSSSRAAASVGAEPEALLVEIHAQEPEPEEPEPEPEAPEEEEELAALWGSDQDAFWARVGEGYADAEELAIVREACTSETKNEA